MNDPNKIVELGAGARVQIKGVQFRIEQVINGDEPLALLIARRSDESNNTEDLDVCGPPSNLYVHIDLDVQPLLWGSPEDRCDSFYSVVAKEPPWIARSDQEHTVSVLNTTMFKICDANDRCLTIVGPQASGKRSVIKRFLDKQSANRENDVDELIPILCIRSWHSSQQFYEFCLEGTGIHGSALSKPFKRPGINNIDRRQLALDAIRAAGVRVLVVVNPFRSYRTSAAHIRQRIQMLDSFADNLDISIVILLHSPLNLPGTWPSPWRQPRQLNLRLCTFDREFETALSTFERRLPLRKPSMLIRPDIAGRLYTHCRGDLGALWSWLAILTEEAIHSKDECINHHLIDRVELRSSSQL